MRLKVLSSAAKAFDVHTAEWKPCIKCEIGGIAHFKVFARGQLPCDVLFVGEAPGKTEDVMGWPFVGRAGKLLDEWMVSAFATMADWWVRTGNKPQTCPEFTYAITNVVLCRPTNEVGGPNRAPRWQEIENCRPRLETFIKEIARPKMVITLGLHAKGNIPTSELDRAGIPYDNLYHPAWVLRNGGSGSEADQQEKAKLASIFQKMAATLGGK